ncbi:MULTISPECIES: SDR family NAD(P)-dependent oxidoreductase [unclassified Sphingobacterium]|uniref:SDR family NAD(P)-dependent oxidoreductase n=2 Tax=Sphingobacterium TaxID=28453 RepID=UPI0026D18D68
MKSQKVWFVTGASKGLGLNLVKELLAQDYSVVATSRTKQALEDEIGDQENFLPLEVDITDDKDVARAVLSAIDYFGKIDLLVNNAGYGQTGTLEELSDLETRRNFEVNVFGSLNAIRHIAPICDVNKWDIFSIYHLSADSQEITQPLVFIAPPNLLSQALPKPSLSKWNLLVYTRPWCIPATSELIFYPWDPYIPQPIRSQLM